MRAATGSAAAIVLAGGSGSRVGATGNKVYLPVAGRPMLAWSLRTFLRAPGIGPVLLVARAEDGAPAARLLRGDPEFARVEVVTGGATRQESELAGLRRLADRIRDGRVDVVLVHDGARPMVGPALVAAVLAAAREAGGAIPALPRDDVALAAPDGASLTGSAPPDLVAVQTPQGFRAGSVLAAYERADREGFAGTDTASCVHRFDPGLSIRVVPGDDHNFKITYPHDVPVAEWVLSRFARGEAATPAVKRGPAGP